MGFRTFALVVIATAWAVLAVYLVQRGIRSQGFATYLDSGNVSGAVIGLVLPGAFLAVWHHRAQVKLHKESRLHNERLHRETRRHVTEQSR